MDDPDDRNPQTKNIALFLMADGVMRAAEDYINRGRQLRGLSTEVVQARFVSSFHAWANDPRNEETNRFNSDCRAELDLRRAAIPFEMIEGDINRLTANVGAAVEQMSDHERAEAGERIIDEYDRARARMS